MEKKTKDILIPFTGGLDSTYLLIKNIEKKNNIQTFYVQLENNHHKTEIELAHRRYILNYLRNKFGIEFRVNDNASSAISVSGAIAMPQPPIWLLFTNFISCGQKTVEISYVLNDCAVSFIDDIKKMYKTYRPFFGCSEAQPKLKFPLIKVSKKTIYRELPKDLRDYTWSCESPNIEKNTKDHLLYSNCGHCEPCKKEKMLDIFSNRIFELDKVTKKITIGEDSRNELSSKPKLKKEHKAIDGMLDAAFNDIKFTPRRQLENDDILYSEPEIESKSLADGGREI